MLVAMPTGLQHTRRAQSSRFAATSTSTSTSTSCEGMLVFLQRGEGAGGTRALWTELDARAGTLQVFAPRRKPRFSLSINMLGASSAAAAAAATKPPNAVCIGELHLGARTRLEVQQEGSAGRGFVFAINAPPRWVARAADELDRSRWLHALKACIGERRGGGGDGDGEGGSLQGGERGAAGGADAVPEFHGGGGGDGDTAAAGMRRASSARPIVQRMQSERAMRDTEQMHAAKVEMQDMLIESLQDEVRAKSDALHEAEARIARLREELEAARPAVNAKAGDATGGAAAIDAAAQQLEQWVARAREDDKMSQLLLDLSAPARGGAVGGGGFHARSS